MSQATPVLGPRILSGEVKISQKNTIELTRLSDRTAMRLGQLLSKDEVKYNDSLQNLVAQKQREINNSFPPLSSGSIKEIPSYDPDAEISALALTIPSWISSINRTHSVTDLSSTTGDARRKLKRNF